MAQFSAYRTHAGPILRLGVPLVGSHLAQIAIHFTDTVMLGRYSVEALAGQVLGATLFFVIFIVGSGFAWAVMPMVARAEAEGDVTGLRRVTRMGLWASVVYGALVMPALILSEGMFAALGQTPEAAAIAAEYLSIAGWAMIPMLLVMVLKSYLSALERTQVVLWVTVAAVGLNIVVNYLLIFGNWGVPEMGVAGAAVASLAVAVGSTLVLALYALRVRPRDALFARFWRPDWSALGQVGRVGLPIGLTSLAESSLFAASTIMMGWLGTIPLAAHGIVLEIASITFMIHMGLSNAATIRAGQAMGRRDGRELRRGALVAVLMSAAVAAVAIAAFLIWPEALVGLFLGTYVPDRDAVLATGAVLMLGAALFQFFDGAQIMALGLLRGVQDTTVPLILAVICYGLLGIPASYLMGFTLGLGGLGIWLGLTMGLVLASTCLLARFFFWSGRGISVGPSAAGAAAGAAAARPE